MCNSHQNWDGKQLNEWGASILIVLILHELIIKQLRHNVVQHSSALPHISNLLLNDKPSSLRNQLHGSSVQWQLLEINAGSQLWWHHKLIALMELFIVYYLSHQLLWWSKLLKSGENGDFCLNLLKFSLWPHFNFPDQNIHLSRFMVSPNLRLFLQILASLCK